jgi:hypothetical protein
MQLSGECVVASRYCSAALALLLSRIVLKPIFDIGFAAQIAIAGWRDIVSIGARALAGVAQEVGGRKASVSRRNGGGKREECGGEELALHGKRLLRYISNQPPASGRPKTPAAPCNADLPMEAPS